MAKKKDPTMNKKTKKTEKSERNSKHKAVKAEKKSGSWFLPTALLVVVLAVVASVYTDVDLNTVQLWINNQLGSKVQISSKGTINNSASAPPKPVTSLAKYDGDGYFLGRKRADTQFMPASMASKYEIKNPEELSPYITYLPGPPMRERRERAMGARFRNFFNFPVTKWWDDGTAEGVYSGVINAKGFSATNTYTTHTFIFRNQKTGKEVARITMVDDRHLYFIGPDKNDKKTLESEEYKKSLAEVEFMKKYHEEHGVPWLSNYPRRKPHLFIYPADFVGQVHKVRSYIGYHDMNGSPMDTPVDFNITVVATEPKVLLIQNLLSQFEIDHIISMGEKVVKQSMVGQAGGAFSSKTRTSENGWLRRSQSEILNRVYYRFADVLQMTDHQLRDDKFGGSAEHLQFVRYLESQRYDPHHDFGYTGKTEQRFSTLLIYLEIPEEGGGTSFPKAFDGQGISVKPSKGDAVLFYSMLPDGNGDDMSLHAGMPVLSGRKYVCNLWSWDPKTMN